MLFCSYRKAPQLFLERNNVTSNYFLYRNKVTVYDTNVIIYLTKQKNLTISREALYWLIKKTR